MPIWFYYLLLPVIGAEAAALGYLGFLGWKAEQSETFDDGDN